MATFKTAQLQPFSLYGGGVVAGATSITLKSMTDIDGGALSMTTDFGTIGFGTLEPGNSTLEEQISFTGLTNNSNGTVTLTGVSNVLFVSPYTQTSGLSKTHAGSTTFVISNTSGFYNNFPARQNDETITGQWTFTNTPISPVSVSDASTTVKGISFLSTSAVSATGPIVVGNNDIRVPTANPTTLFAAITSVPTGAMFPYAAASAPTGFLLCDGSAVNRTTYAALFAIISTSYGVGNGSTTFNIPDTRGRTMIGAGTGTKVATFASRSSNVITVTGLTNAANNGFQTGQAVLYSAPSGAMTGLTDNTTYYLVRTGNLTFSLASSLANAQNATVISLSSDGTGTQTFTLTYTARTVGDTGGEENHAMSLTELLSHNHSLNTSSAGGGISGTSAGNLSAGPQVTTSTGGNAAMNVMNPFFTGTWIIKT